MYDIILNIDDLKILYILTTFVKEKGISQIILDMINEK
jgi:hypothetical protein